jgi:hypothetical protein
MSCAPVSSGAGNRIVPWPDPLGFGRATRPTGISGRKDRPPARDSTISGSWTGSGRCTLRIAVAPNAGAQRGGQNWPQGASQPGVRRRHLFATLPAPSAPAATRNGLTPLERPIGPAARCTVAGCSPTPFRPGGTGASADGERWSVDAWIAITVHGPPTPPPAAGPSSARVAPPPRPAASMDATQGSAHAWNPLRLLWLNSGERCQAATSNPSEPPGTRLQVAA